MDQATNAVHAAQRAAAKQQGGTNLERSKTKSKAPGHETSPGVETGFAEERSENLGHAKGEWQERNFSGDE